MKKKRIVSIIAVATMMVTSLAACGKNETKDELKGKVVVNEIMSYDEKNTIVYDYVDGKNVVYDLSTNKLSVIDESGNAVDDVNYTYFNKIVGSDDACYYVLAVSQDGINSIEKLYDEDGKEIYTKDEQYTDYRIDHYDDGVVTLYSAKNAAGGRDAVYIDIVNHKVIAEANADNYDNYKEASFYNDGYVNLSVNSLEFMMNKDGDVNILNTENGLIMDRLSPIPVADGLFPAWEIYNFDTLEYNNGIYNLNTKTFTKLNNPENTNMIYTNKYVIVHGLLLCTEPDKQDVYDVYSANTGEIVSSGYKSIDIMSYNSNRMLFSKEDGTWGYVDCDFNELQTYLDASSFSKDGYALVKKEAGKLTVIDKDFKECGELEGDSSYYLGHNTFAVKRGDTRYLVKLDISHMN